MTYCNSFTYTNQVNSCYDISNGSGKKQKKKNNNMIINNNLNSTIQNNIINDHKCRNNSL